MSKAYRAAGVDIGAQDRALERIKFLVRSTATPGVLSDLGSFGGLFRPDLEAMDQPVLVASADGVGTKLAVARLADDLTTVGADLVNHCVNDILVQGALPLFFLDYIGTGALDPDAVVAIVDGVARGCRANDCALLGGELAEMPGFYQAGDHELVGFIVGLAARDRLLGGARVQAGDVLIGLPSAGLHTNGYSLARRVLFGRLGLAITDRVPGIAEPRSAGALLLAPHVSYLGALRPLLAHPGLHALAHVTGGGMTDNLPRVLPAGMHARVRLGTWPVPEIFLALERHGEISQEEMFRVFNMGIGMVAMVAAEALAAVLAEFQRQDQPAHVIGTIDAGGAGVVYDAAQREAR